MQEQDEFVNPTTDELAESIIDGLGRYFADDNDKVLVLSKVRSWLRKEVEDGTRRRLSEVKTDSERMLNQI